MTDNPTQQDTYRPFQHVYACKACGAKNCKLWHKLSLLGNYLLCLECAEKIEMRTRSSDDLIGLCAPAIPKMDDAGYYKFDEIPAAGKAWWDALPNSPHPLDEAFV